MMQSHFRLALLASALACNIPACADVKKETTRATSWESIEASCDAETQEAISRAQDTGLPGLAIGLKEWANKWAPTARNEDEAFSKAIAQGNVVVDFFASWCGPCQRYAPEFAKTATKFQNILFLKVNIEQHRSVTSKYGVRGIPTTLFFKDGNMVHREVGAKTEAELSVKINQVFK